MILPAAPGHGLLVGQALAGRSLARIQDDGVGAGHGFYITMGGRGDAGHTLQKVEGSPFCAEQRLARPCHLRHDVARLHGRTISEQLLKVDCGLDGAKATFGHIQPRDHAVGLDEKLARILAVGRHRVLAGHIAVADILGQGKVDDCLNLFCFTAPHGPKFPC